MKFASYGKPLVTIFLLSLLADLVAIALIGFFVSYLFAAVFAILSLPLHAFLLAFFRDPLRDADQRELSDRRMYAPADGRITEIAEIDDARVGGPALKIGIFLSVFDVHINRSPCRAAVVSAERHEGRCVDARNLESSKINSCVDVLLAPHSGSIVALPERIVVRQITSAIARRIVCDAGPGDELKAGERFGMIMFGSRTELIVPNTPHAKVLVTLGQKVYAGKDPLIEYA